MSEQIRVRRPERREEEDTPETEVSEETRRAVGRQAEVLDAVTDEATAAIDAIDEELALDKFGNEEDLFAELDKEFGAGAIRQAQAFVAVGGQ